MSPVEKESPSDVTKTRPFRETPPTNSEPLDEGLQAWLTITGGWLIYFCGLGWIGSFEIALQYLFGIPVGMAFDAGYFHHLMIGGSMLYCFSLFMVSLARPGQYYQIFLAQGVGMGLGLAMTFLPPITVVAHHFKRRRSFAIGILTSGASIGGLVFPIMLNKLIFGPQGFALGVRATAGTITGLMIIGNMLMRTRTQSTRAEDAEMVRVPVKTLLMDIPYMVFVFSGVLLTLGIYYPIFYLQLFSVKHGINANLAFYVVSFMNTGGLFGRLIPNFLADKIGSYNVLMPASFVCAVVVFSILGIRNAAGAIIVALLYGAMNGTHTSTTPAVLSDLSINVSEVGVRMGIYFTFMGLVLIWSCRFGPLIAYVAVPALFGQPISGALLTGRFIWWRATVFSGSCLLAGAILMVYSRWLFLKREGKDQVFKKGIFRHIMGTSQDAT